MKEEVPRNGVQKGVQKGVLWGTPWSEEEGSEERRKERKKREMREKKTLVPREEGHQGFKEREDEGGEWGNRRIFVDI